MDAKFIEVEAGVRYWEDAVVNGIEDEDGSRIPCRVGDNWCPTINLETGEVVGWPTGTEASIHYKVCDDGRYWLLSADGRRIAGREGYVPDDFLCHTGDGYGDYIILDIDGSGKICGYRRPAVDEVYWEPCEAA